MTQRTDAVKLIWITPAADELIAYMARVSNPAGQDNPETAPRLIAYLIRNQHWSPLEMASMCLEIVTTRDIGRQLLRHRSFSFQEFSQRYATTDALPAAPLREARMQDAKNRQNSLPADDAELVAAWDQVQQAAKAEAIRAYDWALGNGIAKEVARAVLPEGLTTTRMYMAGSLRSWVNFCALRMGNGTQAETQAIARAAWAILRENAPMVVAAVEDCA